MKNTFYGFISILTNSPQPGEEAVNWKISIESSQTEIQGGIKLKTKTNKKTDQMGQRSKQTFIQRSDTDG